MLTPLLNHRDSWSELRGLFQQMDEMLRAFDRPLLGNGGETWLPAELRDNGDALVLRMDVPGLTDKDLAIEATQHGVTIRGERKFDVPKGYSTHWRERRANAFTRSFTLPCRVDLEQCNASVKHGVLTLTMAKLPEERPKQVTVSGS